MQEIIDFFKEFGNIIVSAGIITLYGYIHRVWTKLKSAQIELLNERLRDTEYLEKKYQNLYDLYKNKLDSIIETVKAKIYEDLGPQLKRKDELIEKLKAEINSYSSYQSNSALDRNVYTGQYFEEDDADYTMQIQPTSNKNILHIKWKQGFTSFIGLGIISEDILSVSYMPDGVKRTEYIGTAVYRKIDSSTLIGCWSAINSIELKHEKWKKKE